jgi:hypothetical protein
MYVVIVHAVEKIFFWKDLRNLVRTQVADVTSEHDDILGNASAIGMSFVYRNRMQAAKEVVAAISKAETRVWLLGIAFSQCVRLTSSDATREDGESTEVIEPVLAECLKDKKRVNKKFDLKILLLDPLKSPAVFRTFLESEPSDVGAILNGEESFFEQSLYRKVVGSLHFVNKNGNEVLRDSVRLYAHDPSCWLVIADDNAFYEPYTFGTPQSDHMGRCIGGFLPVFKFIRNSEEPKPRKTRIGDAFQILEDHFVKLWLTSDMDCFHFFMRQPNKENLKTEMFSSRKNWFLTVREGLEFWKERRDDWYNRNVWPERRKYTRISCETNVCLTLHWDVGTDSRFCSATVANYSRRGLCLILGGKNTEGFKADVGEAVQNNRGAERKLSLEFPENFPHEQLKKYFSGISLIPKKPLLIERNRTIVHVERSA